LIGGLGVGATILYYQGITAACAAKGIVPQLTIAHANAPTALAHVQAGQIEGLADYLARFVGELLTRHTNRYRWFANHASRSAWWGIGISASWHRRYRPN
jgi:hypothetical protein